MIELQVNIGSAVIFMPSHKAIGDLQPLFFTTILLIHPKAITDTIKYGTFLSRYHYHESDN